MSFVRKGGEQNTGMKYTFNSKISSVILFLPLLESSEVYPVFSLKFIESKFLCKITKKIGGLWNSKTSTNSCAGTIEHRIKTLWTSIVTECRVLNTINGILEGLSVHGRRAVFLGPGEVRDGPESGF